MAMFEALEEAPDNDDGKTIEGEIGKLEPQQVTSVSKLPPSDQFDVLKGWHTADAEHSRAWRKMASEWHAFRAGEQWTSEDKAILADQERPHIVFNRVLAILKAVAGMEINGRHEITFMPRGTNDTKVNEVLSAACRWMGDECDAEDEESSAFDECATTGIGVVENRMSYEDDPAGLYVEEQFDSREFFWDRSAVKKNLSDRRRCSRVRRMPIADAMSMFPGKNRQQLDAVWAEDIGNDGELKSLEERWRRNDERNVNDYFDDQLEVTIVHIQWIERENYWLVADQMTNSKVEVSDSEYKILQQRFAALHMPLKAARLTRKVFKQAWLGAQLLEPVSDAPIKGKFSWDVITGEFDKKNKMWFGLVKVMRDPQMWANKWLSQILHILNSTAKGGILAETDAFDDEREAEESYARTDTITWAASGALSGTNPKIIPKPGAGSVEGYLGLMTFAISSIKDVVGINLELLGQQDQNQPGILEAMRKQAGMTVLATLYDSLRRFRKNVGRSRLYFIQNFLSDGRLIQITDIDDVRVVALAKEKVTGQYSVIVDDTPTSPNQKEANWAIIQPLIAVFKDQLMQSPQVLAMLLEYSPLPSRIVDAIKGFIQQQQNDPEAQQDRQVAKRLAVAAQVASISKDQSVAELNNKKAGATEATAMYDIAMARNLLEDNNREGLKQFFDHIEAQQNAIAATAKARGEEAKARRQETGAQVDLMDAQTRREKVHADAKSQMLGNLIDHLSAVGGVHRDMAAARKDHALADNGGMRQLPQ